MRWINCHEFEGWFTEEILVENKFCCFKTTYSASEANAFWPEVTATNISNAHKKAYCNTKTWFVRTFVWTRYPAYICHANTGHLFAVLFASLLSNWATTTDRLHDYERPGSYERHERILQKNWSRFGMLAGKSLVTLLAKQMQSKQQRFFFRAAISLPLAS